MKKEDDQTPPAKDSKAVEPISKEMQEKIDEWRKEIGKAMAENLNRNVLKESEAEDKAAKK